VCAGLHHDRVPNLSFRKTITNVGDAQQPVAADGPLRGPPLNRSVSGAAMTLSSLSLVAVTAMLASAGTKPFPADAANCNLTTPPSTAGEILQHGDVSRVFPRLPDMPKKYTGCQVLWLPGSGGFVLGGFVYFERGKAVVLYSPGGDGMAELVCRYKGRRLTDGSIDRCPDAEELGIPSMPAGCADKLIVSDEDIPECDYK